MPLRSSDTPSVHLSPFWNSAMFGFVVSDSLPKLLNSGSRHARPTCREVVQPERLSQRAFEC
jgi:hypothetical protein